MKILIIRHAEPEFHTDRLTQKGWREAERLSERLSKIKIDAFFTSPMVRARDTAQVTLERMNREAETLDWLHEFRGRVVNPKTGHPDCAWDFMPQYWTRCPEFSDFTGWTQNPLIATGNSEEVYRETARGLDALLARYGYIKNGALYTTQKSSEATIALFCHFAISMNILSYLLRIPFHLLLHGFLTAPSSVTTLVSEERIPGEVWFRCIALGDTSHLYAADEPISQAGLYPEICHN